MRERKHLSIWRALGAITLSAAITGACFYGLHFALQHFYRKSAMRLDYYILAALSFSFLFLLMLFPANRPLRGFKSFLRWLVIIAGLLVIWLGGSFWNLQGEMLYRPDGYEAQSHQQLMALPHIEEVSFSTGVGTVHGYYWQNPAAAQPAGLVIYFGGIGEFAAAASKVLLDEPAAAQALAGYNYLMMDQPGHGLSGGHAGEENAFLAAQASYDYALGRPDVRPDKIVLIGWSLGTGTAARLAAARDPAGLILMAPFYSGARLINAYIGRDLMVGEALRLVRYRYENDVYARQTKTQALVIAARNDDIMPFEQAEALAREYPFHRLVAVEGDHSAPRFSVPALTAVYGYLQDVLTQ